MKKKFKSRRGFTIVEVLVATAILAIFVSMAIVGTSALFGTGEEMMAVAKAAVLGSDVMKTVTNELRFGEKFALGEEDGVMTYNSTTYGESCKIACDAEGQLVVIKTSTSYDGSATEQKTFYPIGSAAYDEVHIKSIVFALQEKSKTVSCTLAITDGQTVLWEKTVSVVPLSEKASQIK